MTTRVFKRGCRFSSEDRRIIEDEIRRGCEYYNTLIGFVNRRIAGVPAVGDKPAVPGIADRIKRLCSYWHRETPEKAKQLTARAIYRQIANAAKQAHVAHSAASSGCYTGTYHSVQSDFDRAVSAKRIGVWPGAPFKYRRTQQSGACVGVHIQPAKPWSWIRACGSKLAGAARDQDNGRIFGMYLKVSKDTPSIQLTVDRGKKCRGVRLDIPESALVSHVMIYRVGDYATAGKYEIHITYQVPDVEMPAIKGRVGVAIGWQTQPDGSLLTAVTSDGRQCRIPAYAVRMALRVDELQAERDKLSNEIRQLYHECHATSASGVFDWVLRFRDQTEWRYLQAEHRLHCRQAHVQRRYQNIRNNAYLQFANQLRGCCVIEKQDLKAVAEDELKGAAKNRDRSIAACYRLQQYLKNVGAVVVTGCRLPGGFPDGHTPTVETAKLIAAAAADTGSHATAKVKSIRKFRKKSKAA